MEPNTQIESMKKYIRSTVRSIKAEKEEVKRPKDPNVIVRGALADFSIPPSKFYLPNSIPSQPIRKWHYQDIKFFNNSIDEEKAPRLKSWVDEYKKHCPTIFTKLNVPFQMPMLETEDYQRLKASPHFSGLLWDIDEIRHLFDLLELFEGNFVVVADRYGESGRWEERSIEEIKEQTFLVCKGILEGKSGDFKDEIRLMNYNKGYDQLRKLRTEKFNNRTDSAHRQEERLLAEIKNLEQQIKKRERDSHHFKKALEMTEEERLKIDEEGYNFTESRMPPEIKVNYPLVVSRISLMKGPHLNMSNIMNEKLEIALKDLEIPILYGTESNLKLMDQLKTSIIKLLNLNNKVTSKEKTLKKVRESKKGKDQNADNEQRVFEFREERGSFKRVKED